MLNPEFAEVLHGFLTDRYGNIWTESKSSALFEDMEREDEYEVMAALQAHVKDQTPERPGSTTPIGHWPPTAADLRRQMTEARRQKLQQDREAESQKRREEERKNYDVYAHPEVIAQVAAAAKIKAALKKEFALDLALPCDNKLVMRTLYQMAGDYGLPTDEQAEAKAVEIAERMFLEERNQFHPEQAAYRRNMLNNPNSVSASLWTSSD